MDGQFYCSTHVPTGKEKEEKVSQIYLFLLIKSQTIPKGSYFLLDVSGVCGYSSIFRR